MTRLIEGLIRIPMAVLYAVGVVLMIVCAMPFIVIGFIFGFGRWSLRSGIAWSDRAFAYFTT